MRIFSIRCVNGFHNVIDCGKFWYLNIILKTLARLCECILTRRYMSSFLKLFRVSKDNFTFKFIIFLRCISIFQI